MKAKDFKKKYFPSMSDNRFFEVLRKELNISIKSPNDELSESDMKKIQVDYKLHTTYLNESYIIESKNSMRDINTLITYYSRCLNEKSINGVPISRSNEEEVKSIITTLQTEYYELNHTINKINDRSDSFEGVYDISDGSDEFIKSSITRYFIQDRAYEISNNDVMLNEYYQKLDSLNSKKYATKMMERKRQRQIKKVEKKVAKLQSKQSILQDKQKKVINRNARKYSESKQKEIGRQQAAFRREEFFNKVYQDNKTEYNNYKSDLASVRGEIDTLTSSDKLTDRIEGNMLKIREARIKAKMNSIKNKQGFVDMTHQVCRQTANLRVATI